MFTPVYHSVHGGGGGSGPEGVPGPGGGGCLVPSGVPGGDPPDGYCCGRYASYWNAFLFFYWSDHISTAGTAMFNLW